MSREPLHKTMEKIRRRDIQLLLSDTSDAPPMLKRIAEIVGWPSAMRLSLNLGAMQLYIPASPDSLMNHALTWNVGKEAAQKLVSSEFAGSSLFVPSYAGRRLKCIEIVRGYEDGLPVHVLAAQHRITARQVYGIIRAEEARASPDAG
ncbi:MAG: hypothetical protein OXU22_00460 [Gammaproteobacteria bacterium]|nr:hypothetical protein [Gammaproteobacteria bacterium]